MLIFPAIDLYDGKAVRLYKGDYSQMTVYSEDPPALAETFYALGAECLHLVDLEGAKTGETPNLDTVRKIRAAAPLFIELGGGVRSMDVVETYLSAGIDRVILGTAAVTDPDFLQKAVSTFGDRIAVGVDVKDGRVAIKGWTEKSALDAFDFCRSLQALGVKTVICTDIAKDGAMQGTNRALYGELSRKLRMQIVASGGVSSLEDVKALRALDLYGAIIGKAYYTGAIDLRQALEAAT
ncbi:MAG: 1-(5-phosphoribosyl)-5-[Oscillospiraceae bacterium]|nr:1-(5-phosphoribosyl)-5-[(5-phosphoribosylamino)methylideneamino]imidazole-4-carboxamide isomerase [Oscillospiraceae bacterium]